MRAEPEIKQGTLIISLDFELMWGMLGIRDRERYRSHLLGARAAIPRILSLFKTYGIHATWATVGFLFFRTKEDLLRALPRQRPRYRDPGLSPYPTFDTSVKTRRRTGFISRRR